MKVQAIVAAGGTGERMKSSVPKPLILLGGEPVVARTLKVFEAHPQVAGVVLVVPEGYVKDFERAVIDAKLKKVCCIIPGGKTRAQSVRMGLRALDKDTDMVMVHDAVRPFVTARIIDDGLALAVQEKAAVAGVPAKPTLKVVEPKTGIVRETLDRSLVWEIQTPQVFERSLLERAYQDDGEATDDATLVERTGAMVRVFMGDHRNIKITTPEDMDIAEAFLKGRA